MLATLSNIKVGKLEYWGWKRFCVACFGWQKNRNLAKPRVWENRRMYAVKSSYSQAPMRKMTDLTMWKKVLHVWHVWTSTRCISIEREAISAPTGQECTSEGQFALKRLSVRASQCISWSSDDFNNRETSLPYGSGWGLGGMGLWGYQTNVWK